jgi:hypothetical protein
MGNSSDANSHATWSRHLVVGGHLADKIGHEHRKGDQHDDRCVQRCATQWAAGSGRIGVRRMQLA